MPRFRQRLSTPQTGGLAWPRWIDDGSYDVAEGVVSGFPCSCSGGEYSIVEGLEITDFSRERIDASVAELRSERGAVADLGLI